MKIQYVAVIFIIIVIPIILITSYYIGMQSDTLRLQTVYQTSLLNSVKESMQAFEINTVEWNSTYSTLAESKRRDVLATINTFMTSLANNMGISGTSRNFLQSYIPAIAVTLHDGYYIYAPTYVESTQDDPDTGLTEFDAEGNPITNGNELKHVLRPYSLYTGRYINNTLNINVNFSLDNYVKIYGYIDGSTYVTQSGYLIDVNKLSGIAEGDGLGHYNYSNMKYDGHLIRPEVLSEQIAYKEDARDDDYVIKEYKYIYDENKQKLYYDENDLLKRFFRLNDNKTKGYLGEPVDKKAEDYTYRKVVVYTKHKGIGAYEFLYQGLNGDRKGNWYIDRNATGDINKATYAANSYINGVYGGVRGEIYFDYSSFSYYNEAAAFTDWVNQKLLPRVSAKMKRLPDGTADPIYDGDYTSIFDVVGGGFEKHKKQVIRQTITEALHQAIINYASYVPELYDFRMPILTESEWEQIESNVSIIAFLQGMPMGNKYYNGYAIATSTNNNEYTNPNDIFFIVDPQKTMLSTTTTDKYYHRLYCSSFNPTNSIGYKSVDFLIRRTENEDINNQKHYYIHDNISNGNSELACYECMVDYSNYVKGIASFETSYLKDEKLKLYYNALGREKYVSKITYFNRLDVFSSIYD